MIRSGYGSITESTSNMYSVNGDKDRVEKNTYSSNLADSFKETVKKAYNPSMTEGEFIDALVKEGVSKSAAKSSSIVEIFYNGTDTPSSISPKDGKQWLATKKFDNADKLSDKNLIDVLFDLKCGGSRSKVQAKINKLINM
jgi:hypothetical protein